MPKTRKVIGEGAYGCVHDPSLHCTHIPKPNFDYDKYVSKLMKTKKAEEESAEFVNFHKYDPKDEYHLGTPIICKPNLRDPGISADVGKCKRLSADAAIHPDNYDLLVMKYGGPDLKIFCKDSITNYLKTDKNSKSDKFWIEAHHLIKGLQFFKDNGIVHNDLKPQNILYDMKTHKLSFIDFGLMQTKANIIKTSKNNTNSQAVFHWSYPLDCGLMNAKESSWYKKEPRYRALVKKELIGMLVAGEKKNTANMDINKPEAFQILFSYINLPGTDLPADAKYAFIEDFFDGLDQVIKADLYSDYINRIADSIDVYGLGFTLQYILNCFKRHNAVSEDFFTKCSALFSTMYDSNPANRELDIHKLLDEYENICLETGLLTRMNKRFEHNDLVDSAPMPSPIMRLAIKEEKDHGSSSGPLSTRLEKIADMDPYKKTQKMTTKACPPDKELNPKTGRCIKKCGPGQTRNAKNRCTKAKSKTLKVSSKIPKHSSSTSTNSSNYKKLMDSGQQKKKGTKGENAKTITNVNNKFPYEIKSKG